jgi:ribosome maturation factor RimP
MAFPDVAQLTALISPAVDPRGWDVEAVKVTKAGKKSVVAVKLDADDRPTLDDLEVVSNEISELLDAAEERGDANFGAGYTLEVSTPGVDLPLTAPRHWRRNRHRLVALTEEGKKSLWRIGALAEDGSAVILVAADKKKSGNRDVSVLPEDVRELQLSSAPTAVVEVEFNESPATQLEITAKTYQEATQWREEHK